MHITIITLSFNFVHVHHHCFVGSAAAFYRKSTVIDAGHQPPFPRPLVPPNGSFRRLPAESKF
jgi:hypothetical protein